MELYSRRWVWGLVCLAILTVVLYGWSFALAPLQGEDFAFLYGLEPPAWDERFQWLIQRSSHQISDWNARLGEQLAIFWLNMPSWLFWIVSVISFISLAVLSAVLYSGRNGLLVKSLISIGLVFLLWPGLEVFFWKTANAAYLQPILLYLLCILAFRDEATIRWWVPRKAMVAGISVVAFLAGLSFENVPVAVAIYMALCLIITTQWVRLWSAMFPIVAMLAGWLILLTAPSTQHRREYYQQAFGVEQTDLTYFVRRGFEVSEVFFETSSVLFAAALLALGYLIYLHRRSKQHYNIRSFLTVVPAVLLSGSLIMAPYTEPRAFLLAWVLMFAAVVEASYQISVRVRLARWFLLLFMLVSFLFGVKTLLVYQDISRSFLDREAHILENVATPSCEKGVEVLPQVFDYSYRYFNNRDGWFMQNLHVAGYYYDCQLKKSE
jgi:hypothetical protein